MQRLLCALVVLVCSCNEDVPDENQLGTDTISITGTMDANVVELKTDSVSLSSNFCNCNDGMINEYPITISIDNMILIDSLVDNDKTTHCYLFQLEDSLLPKSITNQISKRGNWHCTENSVSPFKNEISRTDSTLSIQLKDTIRYKFNLTDGELHHTIQYIGYCKSIDAYMLSNHYWDGTDIFWVDRATGDKFSLGSYPAINIESKLIVETYANEYVGTNSINIWDFNNYKEGSPNSLMLANLSAGMFTTPPIWINSNQYVVKFYRIDKDSKKSIRTYGIIELK